MNEQYIAGFFDADGYVTMAKPASNEEAVPFVGFTNTVYSILEEIQNFLFETYYIKGHISIKKARKPEHKDSYDLKFTGFKKSAILLKCLPIKHPKKVARKEMLLKIIDLVPKNGKYTLETIELRRSLTKKLIEIQ